MQDHYLWHDDVFESILWDLHGQVVRTFYTRRHFLIKFLHGWLPLGKLQRYYNHHYLAACPACLCAVEDQDHFLCCPGTSSWQRPLLDELISFWMSQHVDPNLCTILLDTLQSWLQEDHYFHPTYPSQYQPLILAQEAIGPDQLFYGRFSSLWCTLQDHYLFACSLAGARITGSSFVRGTINILWEHAYKLWTLRNQHCHGVEVASQEASALSAAQRKVRDFYNVRHLVEARDREVFYSSPDVHFAAEPTSQGLRSWLTTWKPVLLQSIERSRKSGLHQFCSLRHYFALASGSL